MDLKEDHFFVTYDTRVVDVNALLAAIRQEGFEGKIVPTRSQRSRSSDRLRQDMSQGTTLAGAVAEAKRSQRSLLLAFSAPG